MFLLRGCCLGVLLASFSVAAQTSPLPPPIAQVVQSFERAYDAGDAAAIGALLTDDAQWLPPAEPPVLGKAAIERRYAAQFSRGRSTFQLRVEDFHQSGDLAFIHGPYQRQDAEAQGRAGQTFSGKYLMVLQRGADGRWRIARDIWNGDLSPGATLDVDARVALNGFQALVEQRLASAARLFAALANAPVVQSGDWNAMRPLLRSVADSGLPAAAIWFARPDGAYFTAERGSTGASLADRPYFPTLKAGQPVTGALVISRSTGKRSIIVASPVRRGSQFVGAVGVSLSMDALSGELNRQLGLPPGLVFYALDARGQTALHRDPSLEMEYPSDLGDASLKSAVREMLSQPEGIVRYTFRGVPKTVLYRRSPSLGWVFALGFEHRPPQGGH